MGILFISHSVKDNEQSLKVRDWLIAQGWSDIYLDIDPHRGAAPGQRWEEELKRVGERCAAVLILISPAWIESRWCQGEFLAARLLGKKVFPILVVPTPLDEVPFEIRGHYQIADISSAENERDGLERLSIGLKRAGLDPTSFPWPPPRDPHRSVYRGLQTLEEEDAAIFFGRDSQITKGIDTLRRMRDGISERMLVIQAASGAGKSSFLRAGLIARLKRDEENFVVLPVIRPERASISGTFGLAASLSSRPEQIQSASDVARQFGQARARVAGRFEGFAQNATGERRPPTIVVPIDQAEELFAAENIEAAGFLDMLSAGILEDGNAIVVCTIRTDAFARMQEEQRLASVPLFPFSLSALPSTSFKDVIEGPARLSTPPLQIEPALTERLLKDLAADDALPLLAFTLERLLRGHRGESALTLAEYTNELGGLEGAIVAAVESAFAKAMRDPALPRDRAALDRLAQSAFIPALVQIDDADAEPRRRVERIDKLPETSRPLVRHLIDERLLVTDHRLIDGVEADTVEVAHEAILRQWPVLRSWIAEEREGLRALDGVRTAARDWRTHGEVQGWLAHGGGRLEEAERLLAPGHFANALSLVERQYLETSRARENAERERERNEIERDRKNIARTQRLQRNIFVAIGAAVAVVLLAGIGVAELLKGIAIRSSDALATLSEQAAGNQDYESAARYALAGLAGANWPILGYSGERAQRALRTADVLSPLVAVLRGHAGGLNGVSYSPDGKRIVTASEDKTARIWDARTGAQLAVLRGHGGAVMSAAYSPDGMRIVTGAADKTARIWEARTGAQLAVLHGHGSWIIKATYSPDGTRIVTASWDHTARIWDARSGAQLAVLRGHDGPLESAAYSPDGTRVVTTSEDKTARIWDARTCAQLAVLRGHDGTVYDAAYSPDGTRIVTASIDGTARIWDATTGAQVTVLRGHANSLNGAAYSPDGTRIVTASTDNTARIWDATTGAELAILRGHDSTVFGAAFSPDGKHIATGSGDNTARIWDARIAVEPAVLRGHDDSLTNAVYSRDGTRIVSASRDKTARIWDARSGAQIKVLRGHTSIVASAGYSPDGTRIVTASYDQTVRVWDARTGVQLAVLSGNGRSFGSAAYSPDGTRIVTASWDKTARVRDARSGAQLVVLRGHDATVITAAYSPDGTRIVTASWDKTARIWDAATGAQLAVLRGHDASLSSAAYSPDGMHIVTTSEDKTARVWDAHTGAQIAVLRGHDAIVTGATYSPDGKRIVTASQDTTARVWDVRTGTQIAVLRGHDAVVYSAAYSPDGTRIVTASDDKTIQVWKTPPIPTAWLSLESKGLISRTCAGILSGGLGRFTHEELAAAPDLDPKLDADACHPPTFFQRVRELMNLSSARN